MGKEQREVWVDINDYEGYYQVSNYGRVKSVTRVIPHNKGKGCQLKKGILRSPTLDSWGYLQISLSKGSIRKNFKLQRLVAVHFIPNPENKPEVNHKFGNKIDNRSWMLEWVTESQNMIHSYANGLHRPKSGSLNGFSKLKESEVENIKKLRLQGLLLKELATMYNVSKTTISDLCNNKIWKHT